MLHLETATSVYCTAGRPGAGKSVATGVASSLGYEVLAMGDVVRERARGVLGTDATSADIGQWAADHRAEYGPAVFADYTADRVEGLSTESEPVVDGLRSPREVEVFDERFDQVAVVLVTAAFDVRLERLQARGRDGEDAFTAEDLRARDQREEVWELTELEVDEVVTNDGTVEEFEAVVADILT